MMKLENSFGDRSTLASRLPAAAYILSACIGVIGSNSMLLGPIAPKVSQSLSVSVSAVMMASAAFGLGAASSALFLACHIDRLGVRRTLRAAMFLLAIALLGSAFSSSVSILIVAQLAAGIASGVALPAIYTSAVAIAPPGKENKTISVVLTGWTLSLIAGVSFSAVLADFIHWRAVYVMVALLSVVISASISSNSLRNGPTTNSAPSPWSAIRLPGCKPLLLTCGIFTTAFYGFYGFLGDYLHHSLNLPVSSNGLAALAYGIGFGSATLLDRIVDRFGARRLMPMALISVSAIYLLMALIGTNFISVIALMVLLGIANHLAVNLLIGRLSAIDATKRGTMMGLNSAVTYFSAFCGASGFGALYPVYGFAGLAWSAMSLSLIAAVAAAWR